MSDATPLDAPFGPEAAGPRGAVRTSALNSAWALFAMTLASQARSRRLLVLALLYALPIGLAVLIRYQGAGFRGPTSGYEPAFAEFALVYNLIPQALVPLAALVYASGMIQDEVEDQTITYLLIRPLPRWSIYVAKLLATLVVTAALTAAFTAATFLVIGWGQGEYWSSGGLGRMARTIALFALSLTAYNSLFGALSLLMRRAILLGVGYIILLEGIVANIDFVIRKFTVMYYFRVLCERWLELGYAAKYSIDLEAAPDVRDCLLALLGTSLAAVVLASGIMGSREFRVKTPEGS